jgi:GT2 family glycosyltransferase
MSVEHRLNPISVSVVIATYRRPGGITECIRSVIDGAELPQEIIVVGRKGDSATEDVIFKIEGMCLGKVAFRAGWVTEAGHVPPIEKGVELASGEIVAFVDDDVTVTPDWLGHIRAPFTDLSIGVVGGRVITPSSPLRRLKGRPGCISWYGKHWGNVSSLQGDFPIEVQGVTECNWAWRRDLLVSVRFDPKLNFDDASMYGLDLCLQAKNKGMRVIYNSHAIIYHYPAQRPPGLDRADRPRRLFAYTRNYTYIMLKHLSWWRRPIFMAWWFLIGERGGWGLAAVLADTLAGRLPARGEVWGALTGKVQGIRISSRGARADG